MRASARSDRTRFPRLRRLLAYARRLGGEALDSVQDVLEQLGRSALPDPHAPSRLRDQWRRRLLKVHPEIEQLETRWLMSGITMGLYNDTSGGLKITSDDRLSGTLTDTGSVSGKTVSYSGSGISTGTTTSDGSGNYLFTPSLTGGNSPTGITASWQDHTGTTITSSPAVTFTLDTSPPTVTLTAPANSNTGAFQVTVNVSTNDNMPTTATVLLDVDLNNDGDFADAGEQGYTTASVAPGNSVTFTVSPTLSNGTYPVRARSADKAANYGTSSTATVVVNTSPSTYAVTGQQRTFDPLQAYFESVRPAGAGLVLPQTGSLFLSMPLDFDLSPGTAVGGSPALVFNQDMAWVRPFVEATLASDSGGAVPTSIQAQLTFNGTTQSWVSFSTSGHSAGDVYLLAVEVDSSNAVTASGAYPWQLYLKSNFASGGTTDRVVSGTAYVASADSSPAGYGWSIDGVDRLVSVSGGVLWVYGSGGGRFFASAGGGNFTNPANDFGTLTQSLSDSTYTYTAKDQTVLHFDSTGLLTSRVDTHGLAVTYTYTSGVLSGVASPDGGLTTLALSGGQWTTITEPGGRVVTLTRGGSGNLTTITDAAGNVRALSYGSNRHVTHDSWSPLAVTFSYDNAGGSPTNQLTGWSYDNSHTFTLATAQGQGLTAPTTSKQGVATLTDPLGDATTYNLDGSARLTQVTTADGATQSFALDSAGQVTVYTDGLGKATTMTYQYGSSKGDLTQINYPDGGIVTMQYDGTYHKITSYEDTRQHFTTFTYNGQGDLATIRDALNNLTTLTWSNGLLQTVTYARTLFGSVQNLTTTFVYDGNRRLQVSINPLGEPTTLSYDANGNLQTTKIFYGTGVETTTLSYDGVNRLLTSTDPTGATWTWTYSADGQVATQTDPFGSVVTYSYDGRGLLTSSPDNMGFSLAQGFDAAGNQITITDANSKVTTQTFDHVGRIATRQQPNSGVQTFVYDADGRLTAYTDGNGHTDTYGYDSMGRLTTHTDGRGKTEAFHYDTEGNLVTMADFNGNVSSFQYDVLNRLTTATNAMGDVATTIYDEAGNITVQVDERGKRTTFTFDQLNRVVGTTDANGNTWTTVYDHAGRVQATADPLNNTITYNYSLGNKQTSMTTTTPAGGVYTSVYNAVGKVTQTVDPNGHSVTFAYDGDYRRTGNTDALVAHTTWGYDKVGNLLTVTDAVGNITAYQYDGANRAIKMTDPRGGVVTWAYDQAGNLTSIIDRDSRTDVYGYDEDNRVTMVLWKDSGGTVVNTLTYSYDDNGNLLNAADKNGTYTMTYDGLDRLKTQQDMWNVRLTFTYNVTDDRTVLKDSFGGVETFSYDNNENLTAIQLTGIGGAQLKVALAYDARGLLTTITRYSDTAGTTKIGSGVYTYDSTGRLTNLKQKNGSGTVLAQYTYTYDTANRLTTEKDNGTLVTYSYDNADQLTGDGTRSYSYDANGNRSTAMGYTTGTGNLLTNDGTWTMSYDAEGNLTKKSKGASAETWTYGYDNANHLIWVEQRATDGGTLQLRVDFKYDVFANRIEKDVDPDGAGPSGTTVQRFTYDGYVNMIVADLDGSNNLVTRYVYGNELDQLFARVSAGGTVAWYLTDHLGSVRDMVDASGTLQDHVDYDPFGNILSESNASFGDRFKYTGREWDSETGLQYNRARYYDPAHGRWTSQDPTGFAAGDANLYRFVGNSPLANIDPVGEEGQSNTIKIPQKQIDQSNVAIDNLKAMAAVYEIWLKEYKASLRNDWTNQINGLQKTIEEKESRINQQIEDQKKLAYLAKYFEDIEVRHMLEVNYKAIRILQKDLYEALSQKAKLESQLKKL